MKFTDLEVKAADCIDMQDYILVHKDYLKKLQEEIDVLKSCWNDLQEGMATQFGHPVNDAIDLEIAIKELKVSLTSKLTDSGQSESVNE